MNKLLDRLAGRKVVYHGTRLNNLESIYDKGIQGKRTNDPNSLTSTTVPGGAKDKSYRNKVYTSTKRKLADTFGDHRYLIAHNTNYGTYGKTLRI